jgi:serine/threonine protein kinase
MEQLTTNSIISHYRIVSKLGAGGMGEVWLAEDSRLGRKVAIKLLPAEFTEDSERVRRFTQEAKAASALNHPNIIAVHDIGECEIGPLHSDGVCCRSNVALSYCDRQFSRDLLHTQSPNSKGAQRRARSGYHSSRH